MNCSPVTRDMITRAINQALGCIDPKYIKVVRDLELVRSIVNKGAVE